MKPKALVILMLTALVASACSSAASTTGPKVAKIGVELHNQYVVGYSPSNAVRDGKYRKILVKLNQPRGITGLHAFWRTGYFAPTQ